MSLGLLVLIGLLIGLLVLVVVVALLVWGVRSSSASSHTAPRERSAREILDARYARGEISREQYQEMLKDMS